MNIKFHIRSSIYSFITKMFSEDGRYVTIRTMRGPARGLRFRLDLMNRIEPAFWFGTYDKSILQQLAEIIQPGWTIWDCGIYLGYHTNFFARCIGQSGQVIAVEPDPKNLERTHHNVRLNGFEEKVKFVHAAIGAPLGESDFIISNNTNSHLPGMYVGATKHGYRKTIEHIEKRIKVRCMSLDEAYTDLHMPKPDLVKLDIEGAEKDALKYLSRLISDCKPLIVLELHNPECDQAAWDFSYETNYILKSMYTGHIITRREDVHGTLLCLPK